MSYIIKIINITCLKRLIYFGLVLSIVVSLIIIPSSYILAATDGEIGISSTGTANITLTVPQLIRVKSISDIIFPSYSGTGDLNFNKDFTIAVNYPAGVYRVTTSGSGPSGSFSVGFGLNRVPYQVYFNNKAGINGNLLMVSGVALAGLTGAIQPLGTQAFNANYMVKFSQADLQNISAGSYSGTLSFLVSPE